MKLKKLILDNIRSYIHEEIDFNSGSTLLAGDIGSGKTSVLLGIEFGLFGLGPGQRGSILLRNGVETGGVKLIFEVDNKEVIVERTLKKGKTISQDYSAITIDGEKEELSVTELKSRVLSILNYPSEFSKKQNILYKFTVYTPQEEMKQIILEDTETRLNTLRHVFGVDKYRRIIENTSLLRLNLREERRMLEGATQTLDQDVDLLEKKEKEVEEKKISLKIKEKEVEEKVNLRKNKEKEKEEIAKIMEEKSGLKEKLARVQVMLHSKSELITANEKIAKSLLLEIEEINKLNFTEEELVSIEEKLKELSNKESKLNETNVSLSSEISSLKEKMNSYNILEKKMQDLEVCPTCLQTVDAVYRANVLNKNYNERSEAKRKIEEKETEKDKLSKEIIETKSSIQELNKKLTDLKILKIKNQGIIEKENKLSELKKDSESIEKDINLLKTQFETIKSELLKLSKYDLIFEEKSKDLALALKEERVSEIKFAESKKEIEFSIKSISELKERIEKIKELKEKLNYVTELEAWLNKQFTPLISTVEKNVMASLKYEFSNLFSEWFNVLVPENFSVSLSDNFTPIIEQKDYEIDYAYLSGGERTAIALAYRLALNQVINSLMSKIKTKDLVILDEPTDGFSSEQLDKMREVLDQLDVSQLIIVSHEQKIEGFVENIIKFKKEHGISERV